MGGEVGGVEESGVMVDGVVGRGGPRVTCFPDTTDVWSHGAAVGWCHSAVVPLDRGTVVPWWLVRAAVLAPRPPPATPGRSSTRV